MVCTYLTACTYIVLRTINVLYDCVCDIKSDAVSLLDEK